MKISDSRPEVVAFSSWALVMIFELLGARMVGPYIGTSLFVWTSLIAVVLGALSFGYYYWGRLADKRCDLRLVSAIFLLTALSIFILILVQNWILVSLSNLIWDVRVSSIIISLVLFAPTSFLLGLLQPIVTKIRMIDLETWGQAVGKISSIGTIGSIIGTLSAWFFLIPYFWVSTLLILTGVFCVWLSILSDARKYLFLQIFLFSAFVICYLWNLQIISDNTQAGRYIFDTPYSHVTIAERDNQNIRDLYIDNVTHAGMHLDSSELVYEYTKYYHLFDSLVPNAQNMLMLGGAAYSFPKSFLERYPDKSLDVVEIDKSLTELAKVFFRLEENPNLEIFHQDARVYLNTTQKKYDAILWDAFGSYYSIPYQLTTLEVAEKKYELLWDNWVVLLNLIGSLKWDNAQFLESEYLTYSQVFPEVFILPVRTLDPGATQNIMLVALKNPENSSPLLTNQVHQEYLLKKIYLDIPKNTKILTDDFAPVDSMIARMSLD